MSSLFSSTGAASMSHLVTLAALAVLVLIVIAYVARQFRLSVLAGGFSIFILGFAAELILIFLLAQLLPQSVGDPKAAPDSKGLLAIFGLGIFVLIAPVVEEALRMAYNDICSDRGASAEQRARMGAIFGCVELASKYTVVVATAAAVLGHLGAVATFAFVMGHILTPVAMHTLQTWRLLGSLQQRSAGRQYLSLVGFHAGYNFLAILSANLMHLLLRNDGGVLASKSPGLHQAGFALVLVVPWFLLLGAFMWERWNAAASIGEISALDKSVQSAS
jgi:hypothetical protein